LPYACRTTDTRNVGTSVDSPALTDAESLYVVKGLIELLPTTSWGGQTFNAVLNPFIMRENVRKTDILLRRVLGGAVDKRRLDNLIADEEQRTQ
jgi:hypothetical protein